MDGALLGVIGVWFVKWGLRYLGINPKYRVRSFKRNVPPVPPAGGTGAGAI